MDQLKAEVELLRKIYSQSYPPVRTLAEAMRRGDVPPQLLPEARLVLEEIEKAFPPIATTSLPARSLYNNPGWDDVIRAAEEDR
jgi:hypothetical protein